MVTLPTICILAVIFALLVTVVWLIGGAISDADEAFRERDQ